jgi:hypothetical protein
VHALIPQAQHHVPQLRHRQQLAALAPAYFPVLAEDAAQIAASEEDRAGAFCAADAGLLSEVGSGPGDPGESGGAADPSRPIAFAFCPTLTGAIVTKNVHYDNSSESFSLFGILTRKPGNSGMDYTPNL